MPRMHSPNQGSGASLLRDNEWRAVATRLGLSPREAEITRLALADLTEARIAAELGLSPSTVHTYTRRLYKKLNVASRVQLLVAVMRDFLAHESLRPEECAALIVAQIDVNYSDDVC